MLTLYLWAIVSVFKRRLFEGPKRPTWSLTYELMAEFLRKRSEVIGEVDDGALKMMREGMDQAADWERKRDRVDIEELDIDGLRALWVTPRKGKTKGTMLFLHGGGFAIGSPESHLGMVAQFACQCQLRVLSIDYRLAPEHACPAAIEDTQKAYEWLLDQGIPPGELIIAGDSAGGGLVVSSVQALRDAHLPMPSGLLMMSPWVDLRQGEAYQDLECDYILPHGLDIAADFYAGELPRTDPRVSPILGDLSGFPPMMIDAGGAEVLLRDSKHLALKAEQSGADVTLHIEPDELHVYPAFYGLNPRADEAFVRFKKFIDKRLKASKKKKIYLPYKEGAIGQGDMLFV